MDNKLSGKQFIETLSMKRVLLVLCSIILLTSCTQGSNTSDEELILKHVVIEYNKLLAEGYLNLDMTRLTDVATGERLQKAYYHMSALGEARTKMDARQLSITFPEIKIIKPDRAEVRTHEEWDYIHINIDTNEVTSRRSIVYDLIYTLIKRGERWLVSDIDIKKEETKIHPLMNNHTPG